MFEIVLIMATFLCSLVAGFLFAFAVVVMPGIRRLPDAAFIRAFQAMDRVIQRNQPLFIMVWVGSALALLAAAALGFGRLDQSGRVLIIGATLACFLGVQLPTVAVNIPLNNAIKSVDVDALDGAAQTIAREAFEPRWIRWNAFRTVAACAVSGLLLVQLFRL